MDNLVNIIVSACLLGYNCKYNGLNNYNKTVCEISSLDCVKVFPVCPEMDGGLSSPRKPCEIVNDKVLTKDGDDYTQYYSKGAEIALDVAKENNCRIAILKAKSPSCGFKKVYDGTFTHTLIEGNGIACGKLIKNGIKVYTEEDALKLVEDLKK